MKPPRHSFASIASHPDTPAVVFVFLVFSSLSACIPPDADTVGAYQHCQVGSADFCGDGVTQCLERPIRDDNAFDDGAGICSLPCLTSSDCPPLDGHAVVCELFANGRTCVVACRDDDDCPNGTGCEELERGNEAEVHRCMP